MSADPANPAPARALAGELYTFVVRTERETGPGRRELADQGRSLAAACRQLASRSQGPAIDELRRAADALAAHAERLSCEPFDGAAALAAWNHLAVAYEDLAVTLRRDGSAGDAHLGRVKPRNTWRNLFHVGNGIVSLVLYEWFLSRGWMVVLGLCVLAVFAALDVARRVRPTLNETILSRTPFGVIARPIDAHATPSSTWYAAGLVLGTLLFPKTAIELGAIVLSLGDPAAAWVGKRWGRRRLWRDRTWVGSGAFVAVSLAASLGFLLWRRPELGLLGSLSAAAAATAAGAVAEVLGDQVEDNFTIPLAAGAAAALALGW